MDIFSDNFEIENLETAKRLFKESRAGFISLFNNSPICMSMTTTSPDKRVYVRVNNKFIETFGFSEQEIIGRTSVEIGILEPEESARVGSVIREKGKWKNEYIKCIAKDGNIVHTLSSIQPMKMNEEEYLVSFFIDITEIVNQRTIIEQQIKQLKSVNQELESFSYSVSHDLRAPLRAINGYANIIESEYGNELDAELKELFEVIKKNAVKMGMLIDDLLAFSRMGRKEVNKTNVDTAGLVKETIEDIAKSIPQKAAINTAALEPVMGDRALLKQVWINLISNAVKYSSKKKDPVVEIGSVHSGPEIMFYVKDNGVGFDMDYSNKLFGVFQRLHSTDDFEGTGVGLAIVNKIVTKHGGRVWAEAKVNEGATFYFTLPK